MSGPIKIVVDAAGAAGSAVGTGFTPIALQGEVEAVHLSYNSAAPATTDVVLSEADTPGQLILSRADATAAGWFYPRKGVHTTAAGTAAQAGRERFQVNGRLQLSIAGCDELASAAIATIYMAS